ncbi:MAG: gamma-glutamyl-gamma-aminobutyrate hydrolase family protein [Deltaproteobacteria bacterium]|nr:gamma-glutamyl-gamma-aminobutyrate hydrolase family protein [Deltaproteobacteria bacterium]
MLRPPPPRVRVGAARAGTHRGETGGFVRPLILVTPDVTVRQVVGVDRRVYELNATYCDAVEEAGGLPLVAPCAASADVVTEHLARADGVLLTGGDFDVDPRLYGHRPHPKLGTLKPDRTDYERALAQAALHRGLPVLGVCGGMQVLNVVLGGTLWQDLPDERPSEIVHSQKFDRRQPAHAVDLVPGSLLARLYGNTRIHVNTSHHQAVRDPGRGVRITGTAEDGLPEALEVDGQTFCVGVQWHPETLSPTDTDPRPRAVYAGLLEAARVHASKRGR